MEKKCAEEVVELANQSYLLNQANGLIKLTKKLKLGKESYEKIKELNEAIKNKEMIPELYKLVSKWRNERDTYMFTQRKAVYENLVDADAYNRYMAGAQVLKTGTDILLMGGALFAGPGAFSLMIGHTGVTGVIEGGLVKGFTNIVRYKYDSVDVALSTFEGYEEKIKVKNKDGSISIQKGGIKGALKNGFISLAMNLGFNKLGEYIQARKMLKAKMKNKGEPFFQDFMDNSMRMEIELNNAKTGIERSKIRQKYEIVNLRKQIKAEMNSGRSLGKIKNDSKYSEWNKNRVAEHDAAMKEFGMTDKNYTGSKPDSALSDIDITPPDNKTGAEFVNFLKYGGKPPKTGEIKDPVRNVIELKDRWLITDTDTVVWKTPELPGLYGSSVHGGYVAWKSQNGSDIFVTPGGIHYTTGGKYGHFDPEGAFLDNYKKFLDGYNSKGEKDFHVMGKSFNKIVHVAETMPGDLRKHVNGRILTNDGLSNLHLKINDGKLADLKHSSEILRKHGTLKDAGIIKDGMSETDVKEAIDNFTNDMQTVLKDANSVCVKGGEYIRQSRNADIAVSSKIGDVEKSAELRNIRANINSTNTQMKESLIARNPEIIRNILNEKMPEFVKNKRVGYSSLILPRANAKNGEIENEEIIRNVKRMLKASEILEEKLKNMSKNDPSYKQLEAMKIILKTADKDPLKARSKLKILTGSDLITILNKLEKIK